MQFEPHDPTQLISQLPLQLELQFSPQFVVHVALHPVQPDLQFPEHPEHPFLQLFTQPVSHVPVQLCVHCCWHPYWHDVPHCAPQLL